MTISADPPERPLPRTRRYRTGRPDLEAAIDELMALLPQDDPRRLAHARDIVTTAAKLLLDDANGGDVKLVSSALKELRYAFKVFTPFRAVRKVTVFGSARTPSTDPAYAQALEFGRLMAGQGWMVITGAGSGIMEAAHGGAGREASFGVNIHLPFEQQANETVRGGDRLVNFKYFFTRKLTFIKETDGIVLFPGGFGTHDEGFETLTLIQTGKAEPLPVVFIEPPGSRYWQEWNEYVQRHLRARGLVSPDDTCLYRVMSDVHDAAAHLAGFYRNYHSLRFVGDLLVLRLTASLAREQVEALASEFARLLAAPGFEQRGPLPEEADEPELADLPRLAFRFRKDDFAGLRQLIDRINELPVDETTRRQPAAATPEARAERGATPESRGAPTDEGATSA